MAIAVFQISLSLAKRLFPLRYQEVISECSSEYNLETDLILGVIYAESGFRENASSGKAHGLMQISESTGEWILKEMGEEYSGEKLYLPETNIRMGCFYLSYLVNHYGNTETALAAYNAGMGNVTSWLKDSKYSDDGKTLNKIPYGETEKYIQRIRTLRKVYKILY